MPIANTETPRTEATTTATSQGDQDSSLPGDDEQNSGNENKDHEDNSTLSNDGEDPNDFASDPSTSDSTSIASTDEENETSSTTTTTTTTATNHDDHRRQTPGCASGELEHHSTETTRAAAAQSIHSINTNNWGKLREKLFRIRNQVPEAHVEGTVDNHSTANNTDTTNELMSMPEILGSPYENNRSAEKGEETLEQWKKLLEPLPNNDDNNNQMNPILTELYGEPLAKTIFRARAEIAALQPLFETSWKWGEIGGLQLGWIPKRQLLLCLCEEKIACPGKTKLASKATSKRNDTDDDDDSENDSQSESNAESSSEEEDDDDSEEDTDDATEALKTVTRKLECFDIVLSAMREWKLKFDFPELYSNKDGGEFVFQPNTPNESKKNCYKCLIFVARVFATLLLFQQEQSIAPTLFRKVRACLQILTAHVKAHPSDLAKILNKKTKRERDALRQHEHEQKKRRLQGDYEHRETTLRASFALVQRESEALLKMMDYYKTRLLLRKESSARRRNEDDDSVDHENDDGDETGHTSSEDGSCQVSYLETMNEEIAATARRDFAREERFQKKLLMLRQKRMNS